MKKGGANDAAKRVRAGLTSAIEVHTIVGEYADNSYRKSQ